MSHDKWYNKGEVLDDLVEVSGRYGFRLRHVTDRPPAVAPSNDDEMEELLNRCGRSNSVNNVNESPDLSYISELICEARKYDTHMPEYNDVQDTIDVNETEALVVRKVTRLDPEVPEFRPRSMSAGLANLQSQSNKTVIKKENITDNASKNVKSELDKVTEESVKSELEKVTEENVKSELEKVTEENVKSELEKVTEDLKRTIIAQNASTMTQNANTLDSVQSKIRRNAALMSLIRLYATTSPVPVQETPELRTSEATQAEPPVVVKELPERKIDEVSPEQIAESIKKVDSWLSGPPKEPTAEVKLKTFTPQLTPFTYKKKGKSSTNSCDTPKSGVSSTSAPSTASGSKKYVPSKYAQMFYEEFEKEREKRHINEVGDKTLWGYIEKGMYEKKYEKN